MIQSGLTSVTFRSFPPDEIITLACQAGLDGVEWGGDVHVPHGDLERATEVGRATREAGLTVSSYGSYYRAGGSAAEEVNFQSVLKTAEALGAPVVRVWAGTTGSTETDDQQKANVIADLQRITSLAESANIEIALEHHRDTLTDRMDSALDLLLAVDAGNLRMYWQPQLDEDIAQREESLGCFLPFLSHVHVYHWIHTGDSYERRPLAEGAMEWQQYFDVVHATGREHFALLEFVQDDSPEQLYADAETLNELLET